MQRLNEIQRYVQIKEGQAATFIPPDEQAGQSRLVKMRLNLPSGVKLYVERLDVSDAYTGELVEGQTHFLAYAGPGYEILEFYYTGSFALSALGGDIWLDTLDSAAFDVEATDLASYARIWEREERDPRILEIEQMARHNRRLLEEQMAADRAAHEARMDEFRALMEKSNAQSGGTTPASAGDAGAGTGGSAVGAPSGSEKPASSPTGASGEPDAAG